MNTPQNYEVQLRRAIAYCLAYELLGKEAAVELSQQAKEYEQPTSRPDDQAGKILYYADLAAGTPQPIETKAEFEQHRLYSAWSDMGFENKEVIGLVYGGATKIKGYVFESARLPQIRGASGLLDRINLQDVPGLWQRSGVLEAPECIIFTHGGLILALAPASLVDELAAAVEHLYTEETLVARRAAVGRCFSLLDLHYGPSAAAYWADDHAADVKDPALVPTLQACYPSGFMAGRRFGQVVNLLQSEFHRRRDQQTDLPHFELLPYARRCASCDWRPAVVRAIVGNDEKYLCEPCGRKRVFGQLSKRGRGRDIRWWKDAGFVWQAHGAQAWIHRFEEWLGNSGQADGYYGDWDSESLESPGDLEDIAKLAGPEGFIGVIYADGNNLGDYLSEHCQSAADYARESERIHKAVQDAVFGALAHLLKPKLGFYPFEILSIGGDDVFLIVPGDNALVVSTEIARRFERDILQADTSFSRSRVHRCHLDSSLLEAMTHTNPVVGLSAGIVIADHHTPVYFLRELVEELLKSAKKRARELRDEGFHGGTVDFVALKGLPLPAADVDAFRQAALVLQHGELTARPYTWPELAALVETVQTLRGVQFPRSQLYAVRDLMKRGRVASSVSYLYFSSRLDREPQKRLRQVLDHTWCAHQSPPWLQADGKYETVFYDMMEIYDFAQGADDA